MNDHLASREELLAEVRRLRRELARQIAPDAAQSSDNRVFRAVFDQASVAVVVMSPLGVCHAANQRAGLLLGLPPAELVGRTFFDFTHPDDKDGSHKAYQALRSGERTPRSLTKRYVRPDGAVVWAEVTISPLYGEAGELESIVGVMVDISARKEAEADLRVALEKAKAFYDNSPVGLALYDLDLRYISVNPELGRINGAPVESHPGKRVGDFAPEVSEQVDGLLAEVARTGRPQLDVQISAVLPRGGGPMRHWTCSFFPVRGHGGRLEAMGGVVVEITERVWAEEALRDSRTLLAEAGRLAHLGAWDYDLERNRVVLSRELGRIYGLEETEVDPLELARKVFHPDDLPVIKEVGDRLRSGKSDEAEFSFRAIRANDGAVRHVHALVEVKRDESGRAVKTIGTVQDITAQKLAEAERERLIEELRGALAEVKTLSGLLPICSKCKKIRDDHGYWRQIESFIRERSGAQFSHGLCPECMKELYPDYAGRV